MPQERLERANLLLKLCSEHFRAPNVIRPLLPREVLLAAPDLRAEDLAALTPAELHALRETLPWLQAADLRELLRAAPGPGRERCPRPCITLH